MTINAKQKQTAHKSGFKNVNRRFCVATLASLTFEECDRRYREYRIFNETGSSHRYEEANPNLRRCLRQKNDYHNRDYFGLHFN